MLFQLVFFLTLASGFAAAADKPGRADSIEGPALYQNHCSRCHGSDAKGGKSSPSGPDLTRFTARHGGKSSLVELRKIIAGEQPILEAHRSQSMPVWGVIFSEVTRDQDLGKVRIDNLARYLRKIQVK
jgi:mono/diheme cytochrome c family protein